METEDSSPAPPDLEWGQHGVEQLGETLSLSPALQAPGLRELRVMARQGPVSTSELLRGGFLQRLVPLTHTPAQGREPTAVRGRAMDTFLIEKQLEWRQETQLSGQNQLQRVGGGAWEGPMGQTLRSPERAQRGASE